MRPSAALFLAAALAASAHAFRHVADADEASAGAGEHGGEADRLEGGGAGWRGNHSGGRIRALQWNPHWQCFSRFASVCAPGVMEALNQQLAAGPDFANVVELSSGYRPRGSYKDIYQRCGNDANTLFYNSASWSPLGQPRPGCMQGNDRSFVVQGFTSTHGGFKLVVVAAHFPHNLNWDALRGAIAAVCSSTGTTNVLFMADTNAEVSNAQVFQNLGIRGPAVGTDLLKTCCNTKQWGYIFPFDRVIANFATSMATAELYNPIPGWASQPDNEFHKAIVGTLSF